jgi:hypothetical protein
VVTVSSEGQRFARFDLDSLNAERRYQVVARGGSASTLRAPLGHLPATPALSTPGRVSVALPWRAPRPMTSGLTLGDQDHLRL